jgi:site-specific recombinase XerD
MRLFFLFVANVCGRDVADLRTRDLTVDRVLDFLDHLENVRGNAISTRNCRLACLHSFFRHLVRNDPVHAGQYQRVLSVPAKKKRQTTISYLEPEEMRVLLRQPDCRTASGIRDYALMLFLYNTGTRISEALSVRRDTLQLRRPRQVHIHGKGRKDRICPLWPMTATALERLLMRTDVAADGYVFRSARGKRLSRDGADYIIQKHFKAAARQQRTLIRKHVTPHVFRHSCAAALLQAGVDIAVIRDYLGHESIATTGRYAKTNLRMKRRVLETFWQHAGLPRSRSPHWKPSSDLLLFLSSL